MQTAEIENKNVNNQWEFVEVVVSAKSDVAECFVSAQEQGAAMKIPMGLPIRQKNLRQGKYIYYVNNLKNYFGKDTLEIQIITPKILYYNKKPDMELQQPDIQFFFEGEINSL